MPLRNRVELVLIAAAAGVAAVLSPRLPRALPLGEIALISSVLLLGQGLIRDLWIKYGPPQRAARECSLTPRRMGPCMCMESTLGVFGVAAGIVLLLSGLRRMVDLPGWFWPVLVLGVGMLGFALKSLVIDWKARRIRTEHHHEDVTF